MKVTNQKNPNASAVSTSASQSSKKSTAVGADKSAKSPAASALSDLGSSGSARVEVSPRAREISKANEVARSGPDVDDARVAHFQDLIDRGAYKPDASKIADRMVDEHVSNLFASGEDE